MDRPQSDAELMSRMQSGDQEAFGHLVDRYKDSVVNYLTRLTNCPSRAEDMAQETFLRLYVTRGRYQELGKLGAFIYRIATNLARSEHRRIRRQRLLRIGFLSDTSGSNGHSAAPTPQTQLLKQEARQLLMRAIGEMPIRFRVPLVLHELEGLSYQQVAVVTGCRENTVKSRISRGRRFLRQRLDPYVNGEPS